MAKRQDRAEAAEAPEKFDETLFLQLLRTIPVDRFIGMVGRSGLPVKQARKLCQLFKEFKA